jgi:hypothetical protein
MAYSKADQYELALYEDGIIGVPAVEQESQVIGYNDEVEVTLFDPDMSNVDSLTFTAHLTSASRLTIPKNIRRSAINSDSVVVSFEATDNRWTPEVDSTARKAVYESAHPDETELKAVTDIVSADD